MPAISIIIPVYNVEDYLEASVGGILSQTFQDFEIILVNDGSTDKSPEICDMLASCDPRISVIHKENEGAGPTRTRGIAEATGEYLYFPDADDWMEPTLLEDLYSLAKQNDADLVISNFVAVRYNNSGDETGRAEGRCEELIFSSQAECRAGVMRLFPTTTIFDVPWNKLYRRQIVVDNALEFRRLRRCQDAVFNLDFYNCCSRVVSTSKAYYYYRENTQESTWRKFPKDYIDIQIYYLTHLRKLLSKWGIYDGWVKEHYDTSMVLGVYGCATMYDNPRWGLSRRERRKYVKSCASRPEIQGWLREADVRHDAMNEHRLLLSQDVKGIMRAHYRSRMKERLRRSRILRALWRIVKRHKQR